MFLLSVGWLKKGVLVLALLSQTNQKKAQVVEERQDSWAFMAPVMIPSAHS